MSEHVDDKLTFHARRNEEACKDGKPHDFKGWIDIDNGRGGTTVCTRCGLTAFEHSMRYAP